MRNSQPQWYEIRIAEQIDLQWSHWFEDMEVSSDPRRPATILSGALRDQAALYGLLNRLRDLNLTLLAVETKDFMQEAQK